MNIHFCFLYTDVHLQFEFWIHMTRQFDELYVISRIYKLIVEI